MSQAVESHLLNHGLLISSHPKADAQCVSELGISIWTFLS